MSQQLSRRLNQRWEEEELRSGSEELLFALLIYKTDKSVMSAQPFSRKHVEEIHWALTYLRLVP